MKRQLLIGAVLALAGTVHLLPALNRVWWVDVGLLPLLALAAWAHVGLRSAA